MPLFRDFYVLGRGCARQRPRRAGERVRAASVDWARGQNNAKRLHACQLRVGHGSAQCCRAQKNQRDQHLGHRCAMQSTASSSPSLPPSIHTPYGNAHGSCLIQIRNNGFLIPNPNFDKENSNPKDWAYHLGEWQALTSQHGMQSDADTHLPVCSSISYLRMLAAEASHCLHQGGLCGLPQAAQRPCWTQLYRAFAVAQVSTFGMCLGRDTRD